MRLSHKMAMNLFEAAEAIGVRREQLASPLGLDAASLVDPHNGVDWDTLVALLDRLSVDLDGDVERLRSVGRTMAFAPSFAFLRRLAGTLVSLRSLYEAGERWIAPASVPHLVLESSFPSDEQLHFRCSIPAPHLPSAPYLHIFEGLLTELPTMLGLPPATIVRSTVTPRDLDIVLRLPRSRSLFGRIRRTARAISSKGKALDLLEQQRREIAHGLEAAQRATYEIESLFDRLPDLVIVHRAGRIVWANRAAAKTLGYERDDDLIGRHLLDIVDPASHPLAESRIHGELDGDDAPDLVDAKLLMRDGTPVLVEVSPSQIVSFDEKPARLFVGRDVTERMRLQQRLLTADRLASIGMLAAGVAHEVNNPLGYVLNNIEMAVKELARLGDATQPSRDGLAIALEGVDRIRTIVRDLLALSRVDDVNVGPVDARAVVESTLALAAQKIAERADLEVDYQPVPLVRGTLAQLGQLLLNLIANALDAMPPASRSSNRLRVAVVPSAAGGAVVEVSDNGVGITTEHAAHIFDPFFTTKETGSSGLGLAISQRLVAELGGELSFESKPDRGSTFRVILEPADAGEHAEGPRPGISGGLGFGP